MPAAGRADAEAGRFRPPVLAAETATVAAALSAYPQLFATRTQ
jgi:hypothetical protein